MIDSNDELKLKIYSLSINSKVQIGQFRIYLSHSYQTLKISKVKLMIRCYLMNRSLLSSISLFRSDHDEERIS
jgi:hypothetical protein